MESTQQTKLQNAQKRLLEWYALEGRHHLPWRDRKAPNRAYRVLISEIMLQQTQVKAVLERFYFPFLDSFPTLQDLSKAEESEVLSAWCGLGYYSRARNLHKLAKICIATNANTTQDSAIPAQALLGDEKNPLPKEIRYLRKLPGIGAYSAGAIACFGFDLPVSFVDSNIKRILLRLFALKRATPAVLESKAKMILNHQDSFNHNQALLDLGAMVCLPKNPKCDICPLNDFCLGKQDWQDFTQTKSQQSIPKTLSLGVWIKDSKIALLQSHDKLYFGLYNFPHIPPNIAKISQKIGTLKHSYTKYRLEVLVFLCPLEDKKDSSFSDSLSDFKDSLEFFTRNCLETLPLSSLALKVLKILHTKGLF
ncbi:A/G-specific adenine glycosylase [Helicobacter sp. MIT 05-5294]|uniref:A/G-specific adenine glycosylase n=1 Tax=Helicobacter sp. MIT 05-5294 TaxID=1548150 RepID=UPI00051F9087|nr:A/G-specific adenine glycosylase [Helicobacter sp. MIT 05-5294]TLD86797.1 A/G-specific adenine glycosylase [Helicobacter sp. MIT 05-5294]